MPSIQDFILDNRNYGIPEFQRGWSWKQVKIEKFFDSIMRGYPLPRFFTWRVGVHSPIGLAKFRDQFLQKGNTTYNPVNITNDERSHNTTAICDGQQRLSSLLIGLKGYNWGTIKSPKFLYFDLLCYYQDAAEPVEEIHVDDEEGRIKEVQFKFLSEKDVAKFNALVVNGFRKHAYIKVSDFFRHSSENITALGPKWALFINTHNLYDNANAQMSNHIKERLYKFEERVTAANYLDFNDINTAVNGDLEQAVEFFIRINDGGVALDPNELLFALLTRYLENNDVDLKADFSSIIVQYAPYLSKKIKFNFLLRICLYVVTDEILFKSDTFNETNCNIILREWPVIKKAIGKVLDLIRTLGLEKAINSNNSFIPIIYHFYKKLKTDENYDPSSNEKEEILKYFIRSEYSGFWGGEHGDAKLRRLKQNQNNKYDVVGYNFKFQDIIEILPPNTHFNIDDTTLENLLGLSYDSIHTRSLLYLLYRGLNPTLTYHIDHIHPRQKCEQDDIEVQELLADLAEEEKNFIKNNFNNLSNLQLIKSQCNLNKSDIDINVWINNKLESQEYDCLNNQTSKVDYLRTNFILSPEGMNIDEYMNLRNFRQFYTRRKEELRNRIRTTLGIV